MNLFSDHEALNESISSLRDRKSRDVASKEIKAYVEAANRGMSLHVTSFVHSSVSSFRMRYYIITLCMIKDDFDIKFNEHLLLIVLRTMITHLYT